MGGVGGYESKSTASKHSSINVSKLKERRDEIDGEYTIVVTSRYVSAAIHVHDIKSIPIVNGYYNNKHIQRIPI